MDNEANLKTCNAASCHGVHHDKDIKNVPHEQSENTHSFQQKIKKLLKQSSGGGG